MVTKEVPVIQLAGAVEARRRYADTANSRITGVTASGFSALVQEEQSLDVETIHMGESLAFLAFGGSSGNLVGTQVVAAVDTLI